MGAGLAMNRNMGALGRRSIVLCALALLAGCGSEQQRNGLFEIGRSVTRLVGDAGARSGVLGAENLTATDAQLRRSGRPLIKVTRADLGLGAALSMADNKGSAVIWRSADGNTVTLFNGLLIATRGFGNDLASAKVPSVRAGTGDVLREHYYLGGDEVMRRHAFFCDFRDGGRQALNLLGVTFDTDLVVETCTGDIDSFENRYWFNDQGGILKSVQWASPEIGALVIEYVPRDAGAAPFIQQARGPDGVVVISGSLD